MRPTLLLGFAAAICTAAIATESQPVQGVEISADIPTVTVAPRRVGHVTIRLPSLSYALTMNAYCDENWQPASISINVADIRKSFDAGQLQAAAVLESELQIPSNQIAPLRVERFCIDDKQEGSQPDSADDNKITIPAVLSAHASLRCTTESEQSISYVTKPLDVTLECGLPDPTVNAAEQ